MRVAPVLPHVLARFRVVLGPVAVAWRCEGHRLDEGYAEGCVEAVPDLLGRPCGISGEELAGCSAALGAGGVTAEPKQRGIALGTVGVA